MAVESRYSTQGFWQFGFNKYQKEFFIGLVTEAELIPAHNEVGDRLYHIHRLELALLYDDMLGVFVPGQGIYSFK